MRLLPRLLAIAAGVVVVALAMPLVSPRIPAQVESPPRPATPSAALTSGARFLAQFDRLIAHGEQARAVRSALAMLDPQPPLPGLDFTAAERAALRQRLLDLLPGLDDRLAQEVLHAMGGATLDPAWRQAVLARAAHLPASALRTTLLRRALAASADGSAPPAALAPLLTDQDPRLRAAAATALRRSAAAGDATARSALAQAATGEPDPRVRQAMQGDHPEHPPAFAEDQPGAITLAPAAARAPARTVETLWDADHRDGAQSYRNRSTVTIDADGRAHVDTVREANAGGGDAWHVRYDGWAWTDASGATVIDGRGQPVDYLIDKPPHGFWIPDSLRIAPDGTTTLIDDHRHGRTGDTAVPGAG